MLFISLLTRLYLLLDLFDISNIDYIKSLLHYIRSFTTVQLMFMPVLLPLNMIESAPTCPLPDYSMCGSTRQC